MNRLGGLLWCQLENSIEVCSWNLGLPFHQASHQLDGRNCSSLFISSWWWFQVILRLKDFHIHRPWLKEKFIDRTIRGQIEVTASTAYAARFISNIWPIYAAIALKFCWRIWFGTDCRGYSKWKPISHVFGFRAEKPSIPLQAQTEMTLALTLPDNLPGALYKALSTFVEGDLTKIESRPLKTALGEYFSSLMLIMLIRPWSTLLKKN